MCVGGGGGDGGAAEARAREEQRQARIREGTQRIDDAFSGFNDNFFNKRSQALVDFQTPDLLRQRDDARRNLITALARAGQLQSSTAAKRFARLDDEFTRNQTFIADQGRQAANDARANVEQARSNLIQNLNATGDATAAAQAAQNRARSLTALPAFNPLGEVFSDFTRGLGEGLRAQGGGAGGRFGLFGSQSLGRNAGRVLKNQR